MTVPFHEARQFFAVDASGSTAGSIMGQQHHFVRNLSRESDTAAKWGSNCDDPTSDFSSIT